MTDPKVSCLRCEDCGQIASGDEGAPWTYWQDLPPGSDLAVQLGVVRPIPCPDCRGGAGPDVEEAFVPADLAAEKAKMMETIRESFAEARALSRLRIVIGEIEEERVRQMLEEGYSPEHDDGHEDGELRRAAAAYSLQDHRLWPWDDDSWKPRTIRRDLLRSAALLIAEVQRLDRLVANARLADKPGTAVAEDG
jgi:hypothetical protein